MPDADSSTSFVAFAHQLADVARDQTLPRFRAAVAVQNKLDTDFDPVTDADREAERAIRARIQAAYPEHGILGEEFEPVRPDAPLRWVLDPVDGTRAFICGIPSWTTLIALERHGAPFLGVIDQPHIGERWLGTLYDTRFVRGGSVRSAKASGRTTLARARLSTTDPRPTAYFDERDAAAFDRLASRAEVCRFSLDAYAYALLASGELDLVVEAGLAHYDYAALAPVVRGSGGVITNWQGGPFDARAGGHVIAAATPQLHAEALAVLRDS